MTRDSRFDKLEQQRAATKQATASPLHRFETESDAVAPASSQGSEALATEPLKRFEEDGAARLQLDRDALTELPMRRCPACHRESSKWDERCIYCQVSLTSAQAISHNAQWAEARRLTREIELERAAQKRDAEMAEIADERAVQVLNEARQLREAMAFRKRVVCAAVSVSALGLMWAVHSWLAKFIFFFVCAAALSCALPVDVRAWVSRVRRRPPE